MTSYTWHVDDIDAMQHGLRYCQGMNQALLNLYNEKSLTTMMLSFY